MPTDGGDADAPTADAGGGDGSTYTDRMDASTSPPDAGHASELPPTPVDDAGDPLPVEAGTSDAGSVVPMIDASVDAGPIVPLDAGTTGMPDAGMVAADGGSDAGAPARTCLAGRERGGYCWFLGALGQSCNATCAAHGGFVSSLEWIGSRAQGGSLARCDALFTLLTEVEADTTAGRRDDGRGVGCHFFDQTRWWLYTPAFDPAAFHSRARQVCSCLDK